MAKNNNYRFPGYIMAGAILLIIVGLAVFALVRPAAGSGNNNIEALNASVVLIGDDSINSRSHVKWTGAALEEAGIAVYDTELSDQESAVDVSEIITGWHNWKQKSSLPDGPVWLITSGINADIALEIGIKWEESSLVMIDIPNTLSLFSDWQDFASAAVMRWPQEKHLIMIQEDSDDLSVENVGLLFERLSNEDYSLFPGYKNSLNSSVRMIQSSNGYTQLSLANNGALAISAWNDEIVLQIVSAIVNKSVDSEALAGVELNSLLENTHFEIMMRWLIIPAACLLVLLLAAVVGIAVNGVNQSSDLDVRYRYQTLIFYRAVLAAAAVLLIFICLITIGSLLLKSLSIWMILMIFMLLMILLIPDARIGIAEAKAERCAGLRIISGLLWVGLIIVFAWLLLIVVYLAPVPIFSLVWIAGGMLIIITARSVVRWLASSQCRIWLTLPIGALLGFGGFAIVIRYLELF